jgi:hypothetical protein
MVMCYKHTKELYEYCILSLFAAICQAVCEKFRISVPECSDIVYILNGTVIRMLMFLRDLLRVMR